MATYDENIWRTNQSVMKGPMQKIIGLAKLNLNQKNENYLHECLAKGRNWFVTRRGWKHRVIQASGTSRESIEKAFRGWSCADHRPSIIEIRDGKAYWHTPVKG